jgi:hypothetical protein
MAEIKKTLRKRRLRTLNDCVRAGAWLFNSIARDEIEPSKSGKLVYALNCQRATLLAIESLEIERKQVTDFEERLAAIETELKIKS